MATYTQLGSGSSGEEVKKLQQSLVDAGYSVGSAGVDGIYGSATEAAVRKYQQDNGLAVDGIAGNETLGSLYTPKATSTPAQTGSTTTKTETTTTKETVSYDAASNEAYMQALAALQQAQSNLPTYAGTYDAQLQDIYNQIVNRDKFSYDLNADMLYQQYKDQYVNLGQMAMKDTMGQAAALTGGYGSTYGQAVGQQQYDAYLQQLNNVVPELYGMALDQYNAEGEQLYNQYAMLGDMADTEYGRYMDALNQYWQNVSFLTDRANYEREFGYNSFIDERNYQYQIDRDAIADQQWQQQYEEANRQWQAEFDEAKRQYDQAYALETGAASGGSNSSSDGGGGDENYTPDDGSNYDANVAAKQKELVAAGYDIAVDGIWGPETQAAWAAYQNGSSANEYDIEADLNAIISEGYDSGKDARTIKGDVGQFLSQAYRSGVIDRDEYDRLKETYAPAGLTY